MSNGFLIFLRGVLVPDHLVTVIVLFFFFSSYFFPSSSFRMGKAREEGAPRLVVAFMARYTRHEAWGIGTLVASVDVDLLKSDSLKSHLTLSTFHL